MPESTVTNAVSYTTLRDTIKRNPSIDVLGRVATALKVDISALFAM